MFELNDSLISCLAYIDSNMPYRKKDFYDSIKPQALQAKFWLAEEYNKIYKEQRTANIIGAGFVMFNDYFLKIMNIDNIVYYDLDKEALSLNWHALKKIREEKLISQKCLDVFLDYEYVRNDLYNGVVINYSCESMFYMKNYIDITNYPANTVYCFMGSSSFKRGNINVSNSLEDFIEKSGLININYSGEKSFGDETKYLVIGTT